MNKYMLILPILLVALDLATATSKIQFSKMNALKNSSSLINILKRTLAGSSSTYIAKSRPNYITDEEFDQVRGVPIVASNTSVLPLPPYDQGVLISIKIFQTNILLQKQKSIISSTNSL
jgi:hypothetical protein